MAVIQLPDWDGWRIAGDSGEWSIQRINHGKDGDTWSSTNYFPQLHHAVGFAYEKALRDEKVDMKSMAEFADFATNLKNSLVKAVKKATS